jgi:hypothetical protein
MKTLLFITTLTVFLSVAHADPRCVVDPTDPYDPGVVMTKGSHKGECMDASEERAPVILSQSATQITFANFWHDGHFWIATIPLNGFERGIFQTEYFSSDIPLIKPAHVQMRFQMRKDAPVVLIPQAGKDQGLAPTTVSNLFLSVEYMAPKGVDYDLIPGELKDYKIAYTFFSDEALIDFMHEDDASGDGPDVFNQYQLKLSPAQLGQVFHEAVNEGNYFQYDHSYDTLIRNCATQLFQVLDRSLTYAVPVDKFKISIFNILDPVAKPALDALTERLLIDGNSELPTFNQEYGAN